jgi:site-specific recombinase XerD
MSAHESPAPLRLVVPSSPPVMSFLTRVYAVEKPKVAAGSDATVEDYQVQVRHLQKVFNQECLDRQELAREVVVSDITDSRVAFVMSALKKKGDSHATCNKFLRAMKAINRFAILRKKLPGELLTLDKYPEFKRDPRAWTKSQLNAVFRVAKKMPPVKPPKKRRVEWNGQWDGRHDLALLLFIYNSGSRITAAMKTPSSALDLESGVVTLQADTQKDKADSTIDLLEETVEALKVIQPWTRELIFGDWPYDHGQRQWPALTKRLKKMLVAAGFFPAVKKVTRKDLFHKFRRCFATNICKVHGPDAAREMCGHSSSAVTAAYLDPTQTGQRPSCREALGGVITPEPPPEKPDPQRLLFE